MIRTRQTNSARLRRFQRARDGNLALLHRRQDELRDARRPIPLQDALVDEAYFELRESAVYAAYLETVSRYRDVLQGVDAPDAEIATTLTTR